MQVNKAVALISVAVLAIGLGGCAKAGTSTGTAASTEKNNPKTVTVFASTNVWGSVVKKIGKDLVNVKVGVEKSNQDPHDYEPTVTNKADVSEAKIVVMNGGGYDDWAKKLAKTAAHKPEIIDAVDESGLDADEHEPTAGNSVKPEASDHDKDHKEADHKDAGHEHHHHGEFNEHVFYSLHTAERVGEELAEELGKIDTANAKTYAANYQAFKTEIEALEKRAQASKAKAKNSAVLATEPVVGYLLADMGLKDLTPKEYVAQSETDSGPSVQVMEEVTKLLTEKKVRLLILNAQTQDPVSKKLEDAAKNSQIPVAKVYESFPEGTTDYIKWIGATIDELEKAIS